jgi:hypothetical protein
MLLVVIGTSVTNVLTNVYRHVVKLVHHELGLPASLKGVTGLYELQ